MVRPTTLVRRKSTGASERAHFISGKELSNSRRWYARPTLGSHHHQHLREIPNPQVLQSIKVSVDSSSALLLDMPASPQPTGSWSLTSTQHPHPQMRILYQKEPSLSTTRLPHNIIRPSKVDSHSTPSYRRQPTTKMPLIFSAPEMVKSKFAGSGEIRISKGVGRW
jgi:hypothetical protein